MDELFLGDEPEEVVVDNGGEEGFKQLGKRPPKLFHLTPRVRPGRLCIAVSNTTVGTLPPPPSGVRPMSLPELFKGVYLPPGSEGFGDSWMMDAIATLNPVFIGGRPSCSPPPRVAVASKKNLFGGKGRGADFQPFVEFKQKKDVLLQQQELLTRPSRTPHDIPRFAGADAGEYVTFAISETDKAGRLISTALTKRGYRDGAHHQSHRRRRRKWSSASGINPHLKAIAASQDCCESYDELFEHSIVLIQRLDEIIMERLGKKWAVARFRGKLGARQVLHRFASRVLRGEARHGTEGRSLRLGVGTGYFGGRGSPVKAATAAVHDACAAGNPAWRQLVRLKSGRSVQYAKHVVTWVPEPRTSKCCSHCGKRVRIVGATPSADVVTRELLLRDAARLKEAASASRGEPVHARKERSIGTRELREQRLCANPS